MLPIEFNETNLLRIKEMTTNLITTKLNQGNFSNVSAKLHRLFDHGEIKQRKVRRGKTLIIKWSV